MIKNIALILILLILIIQYSCEKPKEQIAGDVVINELMPVNSTIVADQNGEYDDWVELFNKSSATIDLSGYYLTDSKKNLSKWQLPLGTSIAGNSYLIVWADKDTTQSGLHSNFKLSSLGEKVLFVKPDLTIIDQVEYPAQSLQLSYSRHPNGTGSFIWQTPTFYASNNLSR